MMSLADTIYIILQDHSYGGGELTKMLSYGAWLYWAEKQQSSQSTLTEVREQAAYLPYNGNIPALSDAQLCILPIHHFLLSVKLSLLSHKLKKRSHPQIQFSRN